MTLLNHVEADHPLIKQTGGRRAFPTTDREISVGNQRPLEDDILSTSNQIPTSTEHNEPPTSNHNVPNEENGESALNNMVQRKIFYPKGEEKLDMLIFLANRRSEIRNYLIANLKRSRSIKWNLCIQIGMERDRADTGQNTSPYFRSRTYLTLTNETLREHDLNEALQKMHVSMEKFLRDGSGWHIKRVIQLEITTVVYKPLAGSSHMPLSKSLAKKKESILNI